MSETPLHFKTITDLSALIKSKALSPVEVTEAMLTRIQAQDPQYKSRRGCGPPRAGPAPPRS